MAAGVRIRVCSGLVVESSGRTLSGSGLGSRKARTLLGLLAASRDRSLDVDTIAEALWPDERPTDPAANIATLVSRTRRLLGNGVIVSRAGTYRLDESCSVDLDEVTLLVAQARDRAEAGEPALAHAAAQRALDLLGAALPGEADSPWVQALRREVDEHTRNARHLVASLVTDTDPAGAATVAAQAVAADPYDERAVRDLMRARAAEGAPAAALATYDELATRLREELGADPDVSTSALNVALLRGERLPDEQPENPRPRARRSPLVGRAEQLAVLEDAWSQASTGRGGLLLVTGEPGVGKTRLLEAMAQLAAETGGLVLQSRCRPAEHSLFLQPFVEALRPLLLSARPGEVEALVAGHEVAWVGLLPELAELVDAGPREGASAEMERRRAYDAVAGVLRRVARSRPVLLTVDDLQDAGAATVDLLGHLAVRIATAQVLVVTGARDEDPAPMSNLSDLATPILLGPLPRSAVEALAAAEGVAGRAAEVLSRTGGHPLSVVECLRALREGEVGVPASLAEAIGLRIDRLPRETRDVLEAASVIGGRITPGHLAAVTGTPEIGAARECEELVRLRLMNRAGADYEVVNDLVQECVHASLAPALAIALHRRAADVFTDRPEAMARHAAAAGEPDRAALGWWLAGRQAMTRSAVDDALTLFDRALEHGREPGVRVRTLLGRARAHEARREYAAAFDDVDAALGLAGEVGDQRLAMAALRVGSSDIPVALRRPRAEIEGRLREGLRVASALGDRHSESHFAGRLAAVAASDLRLRQAHELAAVNLERHRATSSEDALVLGLDAVKTVSFHLGDGDALERLVDELEPLLRRRGSTWMLQWTTFESALVPASRGDWASAQERVERALALNERSGYPLYGSFFLVHAGWLHRLSGEVELAVEAGERAVHQARGSDHPWWYAATAGAHAATLLEAGLGAEAADLARRGLAVSTTETAAAWRLRCLAPLAVATGDPDLRAEATSLLESVDAPEGAAWLLGADCYLLAAQAWLSEDPERAAALVAPLARATGTTWTALHERASSVTGQSASATSRAARRAPSSGTAR